MRSVIISSCCDSTSWQVEFQNESEVGQEINFEKGGNIEVHYEQQVCIFALFCLHIVTPRPLPPVDYLTTIIDEGFVNTITKFHHIED